MPICHEILTVLRKASDPTCSLAGSSIPKELFLATRPDASRTDFSHECRMALKDLAPTAIVMPGRNLAGCSVTIDYYPAAMEQVIHIGFGNDGRFKTINEPGGKR